jgi:hypothetical protein
MAKARLNNSTRARPSKGKTATRWRATAEAAAFVCLVDAIRYADCRRGKPLAWAYVLRHLESMDFGVHKDPAKLKADYWTAVNHSRLHLNDPRKPDQPFPKGFWTRP